MQNTFIKVLSRTSKLSNNRHNNPNQNLPQKPTTNNTNNNLKIPNKTPAVPTSSTNPIDIFSI